MNGGAGGKDADVPAASDGKTVRRGAPAAPSASAFYTGAKQSRFVLSNLWKEETKEIIIAFKNDS